jgi:putative ABC transport system permease protein
MYRILPSLRNSFRVLLKSPGFTITAVLILGFGIGVNTAIFTLVDAVALKPLPFPEADRLVQIFLTYQGREDAIDYPDYLDICAAQHSFSDLSVISDNALDMTGKGKPQRLNVDFVSASMFKVSGRSFLLGRPFNDKEDIPGGPLVVVLSEEFWKRRLNSDPNIVGTNLILSDHNFEVIGVAPEQLNYWSPCDVYVPVNTLTISGYPLMKRDVHLLACIGRLQKGTDLAQAQADLEHIHSNLINQFPEAEEDYGIRIVSLRSYMVDDYSRTVWLLFAAAGCVLITSCANIANLLLARGVERRKEMMVRAALGAGRLRLLGQLLIESASLSLLGGVLGVCIANRSIAAFKVLSLQDIYRVQHRFQEVTLDGRALWFVVGITAVTVLLSGFLPAFSLSKTNLGSALRDDGGRAGTAGPQRRRTWSILLVGQVALTCVLLIVAGLLGRSFQAAQSVPLGFNPERMLTAEVWLKSKQYQSNDTRKQRFWDGLLDRVRQLPGVSGAALNDFPPFYFGDLDWGAAAAFNIVGQPDPGPGKEPKLDWNTISPGYFRTLQIPLLRGRDFDAGDNNNNQHVVIIDQGLASRYFPNQEPLGREIAVSDSEFKRTCKIVGIVGHVRYAAPDHTDRPFQAYFPYMQYQYDFKVLLLRSFGDPARLVPAVQGIVASLDPTLPIAKISTLNDLVDKMYATRKRTALIVGLFSIGVLVLSSVGLYGLLAYSVAQRRREIGVRIAVGAQASSITRLVIGHGISIVLAGLLIGMAAALALANFMTSVLYGVSAYDPFAFAAAVVVLILAAFLASLLPTLRAIRTNPIAALRQ